MGPEQHVKDRYNDTPFTVWLDQYADGHIHRGYWPTDRREQTFADEHFDRAWTIEMLVHVPDREPVLREVHRVLGPGGRIVIADYPTDEPFTTENEWVEANHFVPSSYAEFEGALEASASRK